MIRYVVLLGLLSAAPLSAQTAGDSFAASEKLAAAMAGCVWERKPETAKLLATKGLSNDPEVSAAGREAFQACTDVYGENAVTGDGQPVSFVPAQFLAQLKDQDPDRPQTLAEEMREFRENENDGGGS